MYHFFFFFPDPAPPPTYTLSLHDALPIYSLLQSQERVVANKEAISLDGGLPARFTHEVLAQARDVAIRVDFLHLPDRFRSEEHTSELQSRGHLVCRLLLEKKKKKKINTHI